MAQMKILSDFSGSNTDGSFTMPVLNSSLSPLEKNPIAADLGSFKLIFFYILKWYIVCTH